MEPLLALADSTHTILDSDSSDAALPPETPKHEHNQDSGRVRDRNTAMPLLVAPLRSTSPPGKLLLRSHRELQPEFFRSTPTHLHSTPAEPVEMPCGSTSHIVLVEPYPKVDQRSDEELGQHQRLENDPGENRSVAFVSIQPCWQINRQQVAYGWADSANLA